MIVRGGVLWGGVASWRDDGTWRGYGQGWVSLRDDDTCRGYGHDAGPGVTGLKYDSGL